MVVLCVSITKLLSNNIPIDVGLSISRVLIEGSVYGKLNFTLPSWVVKHALCLLEERKKDKDSEEAIAMTSNHISSKTFEELCGQSYQKNTRSFSHYRKKASAEPNLKHISEEENHENKNLVLQKLSNKVTSLQSELEELKNLIHKAMDNSEATN